MPADYRKNHYVPVWYQQRFIPPDQANRELIYQDLKPRGFRDERGVFHDRSRPHRWGPRRCFADRDLYTSYLGPEPSTELEQVFFGRIDSDGKKAVEHFADYSPASGAQEAFHGLLAYIGTQKLRTPKGLGWLKQEATAGSREAILRLMVQMRNIYQAIWVECVWLIADATESDTKFILSDHPVTIYNRTCGPRSRFCRGFNDPDIRFHASHTMFPLSLDKILILTNLSWVRNPYQSERGLRPNPRLERDSVFNLLDVQTQRHLTEKEVREINFIIKSRALRYVAAAREEWLRPEEHVSKSQWPLFGDGYLLMPDPRPIHAGGTIHLGYDDGRSDTFDEYGRKPWDPEFQSGTGVDEAASLYRFKGEFARLYGPCRRGRTFMGTELERECDSDDFHQYHLSLEEDSKKAMRRGKRE